MNLIDRTVFNEVKTTDNGFGYNEKRILESDEKHARLIATEYYHNGKMVRRDVCAQLKEACTNADAFDMNQIRGTLNG